MTAEAFASWVILELMGHRRLGGYLTEVTIAGQGFLRIDIPEREGHPAVSQLYSPSSVYAMTPCSEDAARRVGEVVEPLKSWELPRRELAPAPVREEYDDPDEGYAAGDDEDLF